MLFRDDRASGNRRRSPGISGRQYEGLVITPEDWPPLLHPRMLMDHEGYSAWERHMVTRCAEDATSPEERGCDTRARRESPAPLSARRTAQSTASSRRSRLIPSQASVPSSLAESLERSADEAIAAVPDDMKPLRTRTA